MTFEAIVEECRARLARPPGEVAATWKAEHPGGRAIGCFPVYTPLELIHAAGALPLAVAGGGTTVELTHADSRFQSFVCSIAKTTLELGFQGRLAGLDGVLFHSICDVARNLSSVMRRNFPDLFVEYLHLPQNTASEAAVDYLEAEYRRLLAGLERLVGHPVTEDDLSRSILAHNWRRGLLRRLYAFRAQAPHLLSLAECALLTRAAGAMPVESYGPLLEAALVALGAREGRLKDRVRVVVEGAFCEQPPLGLLEVIEEAGCYVLDDDLMTGWRWFTEDVPVDGAPLRALAEAYRDRSEYSSIRHDWRKPKAQGLLEKVRRAGADAVLFLPAKFCEPALFDYVLYREALEREGIPHLVVEFEEKQWTFERTRNEIETFVESLLFD
ncbi:MAG: 2-hydroxyacyl-CoA dehydratase [Candidatus Rokubacteria bacterium]|nr:2-hydroxyacyl-CoA dehydratase [Candidatus Rokubacteria bacterium]